MIDLKKLDASAALIAGHYQLMLDAMSGHLARALDSSDPTTPQMKTRLHFENMSSINMLTNSTLAAFGILESVTRDFMMAGVSDAKASLNDSSLQMLTEHVGEMLENVRTGMHACALRDAATVEHELRKVALQVELLQTATGINKVGALIKVKFGKLRGLDLVQKDRVGRKRKSADFVRSMVRWHLLSAYVEAFLFGVAKSGEDLVQVVYAGDRRGRVFSITGGTPEYPSYADIVDEFHPNSTASVERVK